MGVMTPPATRLGLRSAAATAKKEISSGSRLSLFIRRSFSTNLAAATTDDVKNKRKGMKSGMKLNNENKSLYLCFLEWKNCMDQVVRPIRLDSYDDNEEEELNNEAAVYNSSDVEMIRRCSSLGSQILFAVGPLRHICWIDTLTQPLKFKVSSPKKSKIKIKSFSGIKGQMVWGEVDHKLYCLNKNSDIFCRGSVPHSDSFEVLDPRTDAKWQPLDAPPFIRNTSPCNYVALFLNESKKILGWEYEKPGVFCFDTTNPENGWIESPSCLGDTIPFIDYGDPLVIHNSHPRLGAFNLIFAFDPLKEPLHVSPFFISDSCNSFQSISTPIQLPELCYEYIVYDEQIGFFCVCDDDPHTSSFFEFVHLGAQKVGLVLHKFFEEDPDRGRNKGIILLITFEYDIIITSNDNTKDPKPKPTLEIQTRLLGTRRFRYFPDAPYNNTLDVIMTGAFFI